MDKEQEEARQNTINTPREEDGADRRTYIVSFVVVSRSPRSFWINFTRKRQHKDNTKATKRQQKPDFSYAYGEYLKLRPMRGINLPGGSLGRSQACNIALRMWGDEKITDQVMDTWLDRLWARNGWLSIGRKRPIPHESWFAVAGYFYYYGHFYASLCIESLKDKENANYHKGQLAAVILPLQEKEGSWWDYPFYSYHRPYGTAFALMTLSRCL